MPKFADRLRSLRNERDMSQMELAKALGLSKSSINMYERGEREPGLEMMEAIADFFNVDMDYLHGKSDFKNKHSWLCSLNPNNTPTEYSKRKVSRGDIAFALSRGREAVITDEIYEEVQNFYDYVVQREAKKVKDIPLAPQPRPGRDLQVASPVTLPSVKKKGTK